MKYDTLRPMIRSGDVIMWRGTSMLQRAIRFFSGDWSHVSICLRVHDSVAGERIMLAESNMHDGYHPSFLSKRLTEKSGTPYYLPSGMSTTQSKMLHNNVWNHLAQGIKYDLWTLPLYMITHLTITPHKVSCIEALIWEWSECGYYCGRVPHIGDLPKITKTGQPVEIEL